MSLEIIKECLNGVLLINNFHVEDYRGGFTKSYEREAFKRIGLNFSVYETFSSFSAKHVIRGLHFQTIGPQAKLVSVVSGSAWDVVVDLRLNSPTYMKWYAQEISQKNHISVYVPKGFAHGFLSLDNETVMLYQCDGNYNRGSDTGIRFDDPDIGIRWPIELNEAIVSEKDKCLMSFKEYEKNPIVLG